MRICRCVWVCLCGYKPELFFKDMVVGLCRCGRRCVCGSTCLCGSVCVIFCGSIFFWVWMYVCVSVGVVADVCV